MVLEPSLPFWEPHDLGSCDARAMVPLTVLSTPPSGGRARGRASRDTEAWDQVGGKAFLDSLDVEAKEPKRARCSGARGAKHLLR